MRKYISAADDFRDNKIMNPRGPEYMQYLDDHIHSVIAAWHNILRPAIEGKEKYQAVLSIVDAVIPNHDNSKYSSEEFFPYLDYFYPSEGRKKDSKAFDIAWLLHQNRNPHHPQYWILIRDEGEVVPLDMPLECILEMLCDWHSFSSKDPESTAYNWYNKNKKNMTLSDKTRKEVEKLIEYLQEPLVR